MKKYLLKKSTAQFDYYTKYLIKEGCTQTENNFVKIIKEFDDRREALEMLSFYKSHVEEDSVILDYYVVTEYFVEIVEVDEKGRCIATGDIIFSKMKIEVVEKPTYQTVGKYNCFIEAERHLSKLNDGYIC